MGFPNIGKGEKVNSRISYVALLGLALATASIVIAQDSGSSEKKADRPKSRARLVKPWADLTTLSADEKEQILEIHADAVARMNDIRKQEESDIMALLTPENKAELTALKEKQKADAKARKAGGGQDDGEK